MSFNLTGKQLGITPAMKQAVLNSLDHAKKTHSDIVDISVILSHENQRRFVAETVIHVTGKNIFVKSIKNNMYEAISEMGEKAAQSLQKAKEKNSRTKHYSPKRDYQQVEL
jgi:ribosomal subunit interface protein